MTPQELYNLPPIQVSMDVYRLRKFMKEIDFYDIDENLNKKIYIKYYANHCSDGERVWELYTVSYGKNAVPFMICQEAGRGGDDYYQSFITNKKDYDKAVHYLMSFIKKENDDNEPGYSLTVDIPNLDKFYSAELSHFYDPNFIPKYKEGDIVLVALRSNPRDFNNKEMIQTRVQIGQVKKFNPNFTYWGMQLDRTIDHNSQGFLKYISCEPGQGTLGATFRDKDIVRKVK